jgi:hypothetical protein
MPIRLNLLAEAQAAEELRRRDPVKRALWIGGVLVSLMLIWSLSIQFKAIIAKQQLARVDTGTASHKAEYQAVQEDLQKLSATTNKLGKLRLLSASRLLQGTVLNVFQQSAMDDIQMTKLKIDQKYAVTEEVKAKTNGNKFTAGKPATVTEQIVTTVDARDFSANPGDEQVNKYKEKLAAHPYFQSVLGKTNEVRLLNVSRPTTAPEGGGPYVDFSLEIRYPDKTR